MVRRLRENHTKPPKASDGPGRDIVCDATIEIRTSIVFATVIIVLVFLPVFGLTGIEGRLALPLAFAYIVALLASLAVAIVVTPALCLRVSAQGAVDRARPRWVARPWLKQRLGRTCRGRSIDRPAIVYHIRAASSSMAGPALSGGTSFLPAFPMAA